LNLPNGANHRTDIAGGSLTEGLPTPVADGHKGEKATPHALNTAPSEKGEVITDDDEDEDLRGERPTEEEKRTLRRVGDPLPKAAFLVAVVELCERFTYYGASGIFQNYVQRPLDGSKGRGALGLGHQGATGLTTFFQFWCYGKLLRMRIHDTQY
jgi:POT family proton-dependent oligopeptide transporter